MSRYYIVEGFRPDSKDKPIRDSRFNRYYDRKGRLVFNLDTSIHTGKVYSPLTELTILNIYKDWHILVPADYVYDSFKEPTGKTIIVRIVKCCYDDPHCSNDDEIGVDSSDA